jgi:2-polyprenyl-6-methoxyphenol hydroxylase-like FAD-dependent oxidoreductase
MPVVDRVLIVGAGISGMSLAICLRQAGITTDLIEINSSLGTYGAGISLTGPGLRASDRLGVLSRVKREGYCSDCAKFCDAAGNVLFTTPPKRQLGNDVPNGGGIMRPVLHAILADATQASGAQIRLGVTVTRLEDTERSVEVIFSDGSQSAYDLVVGADGINSRIRAMLFPDAPSPAFTGQGCWRAVAQRPPDIDVTHLFLGGPVKTGLNPVSQSEMYMFVLQHAPDNPRLPSSDLHKPLAALLDGFKGPIGRVRDELGPHSRIVYRPLEKLLLAPPWHKGHAVLIGDSAHATTPHLASGAAIGLEDAIVLTEELVEGPTLEEALERFMARRFERCRLVVENSAMLGVLEMQAAPVKQHTALSQQSAAALAQPF